MRLLIFLAFFQDKTVQIILKNVKSLLSSSKTRYQGLEFLSKLLGRLNSDIFIENSSVLIQHVFKVLQVLILFAKIKNIFLLQFFVYTGVKRCLRTYLGI